MHQHSGSHTIFCETPCSWGSTWNPKTLLKLCSLGPFCMAFQHCLILLPGTKQLLCEAATLALAHALGPLQYSPCLPCAKEGWKVGRRGKEVLVTLPDSFIPGVMTEKKLSLFNQQQVH